MLLNAERKRSDVTRIRVLSAVTVIRKSINGLVYIAAWSQHLKNSSALINVDRQIFLHFYLTEKAQNAADLNHKYSSHISKPHPANLRCLGRYSADWWVRRGIIWRMSAISLRAQVQVRVCSALYWVLGPSRSTNTRAEVMNDLCWAFSSDDSRWVGSKQAEQTGSRQIVAEDQSGAANSHWGRRLRESSSLATETSENNFLHQLSHFWIFSVKLIYF